MTRVCLAGGVVYDPRHGVDGKLADVWIEDGRIVDTPADSAVRPDRLIDATGMVVMPGGVDIHSHIAGPKVNTARMMMPEERRTSQALPRRGELRSGTVGTVPSSFATGYLYAGLGYTTAFDAAIAALSARHAHLELQDTPLVDKGFFILMGNNHYAMQAIADGEPDRLRAYVAWMLGATKAYGVKIVNPGGLEIWKQTGGNTTGLDETVPGFSATPRAIVRELAAAADALHLPHSVHIHCNQLGIPGNWTTTLETMKSLEGHRGHITHAQFHSYGGDPDSGSSFCSATAALAEYVNGHPNITVDVGQIAFGQTVSMTADGPVSYFLHRATGGRKWFSYDTECETGCGIVPIAYKEKSLIHAVQWATGLEWYLLVRDPWQIAMSTDHPNGGSFLAYPEIIALLMDKNRRRDKLQSLPAKVRSRTILGELDREYSLYEIAIITRASPARILGLDRKGHLGAGADGDVTVYQPQSDAQRMFELPRYVLHAGEVVVDGGEVRGGSSGRVFHVSPDYDEGRLPHIREWFERSYSIQFENYQIGDHELAEHAVIE